MALDWLPVSTALPPRPSARLGGSVPLTQTYDPILNPAPPTELTWQGSAAPPIYPPRLPGIRSSSTWVSSVLLPNVSWLPQGPRRVWPRKFLAARATLAAGAGVIQVPFYGWKTIKVMPRPPRRFLKGSVSYVTPPSAILAAATCVEWEDTSLVRPLLAAEGLVRPLLTDGVPGADFLALESGGLFRLESGGFILLETQTASPAEGVIRPTMVEESLC